MFYVAFFYTMALRLMGAVRRSLSGLGYKTAQIAPFCVPLHLYSNKAAMPCRSLTRGYTSF